MAEEEPSFPNKSPSLKGRAVTEEEEPGSEVQLGPWDLLLNTLSFSANLTIPATPTGVRVWGECKQKLTLTLMGHRSGAKGEKCFLCCLLLNRVHWCSALMWLIMNERRVSRALVTCTVKQNVSGEFLASVPPSEPLWTPCHRYLVCKLQCVILKGKVQGKTALPRLHWDEEPCSSKDADSRSESDPRSWISDRVMLMQLDEGREFG